MHLAVHQFSRRTRWGVWSPPGCRRRSCRHRSVHGEAFWEERADRVAAAPKHPPIDREAPDSIHFRPQTNGKVRLRDRLRTSNFNERPAHESCFFRSQEGNQRRDLIRMSTGRC